MVAYGATLRRARRPGWEDAYLSYSELRSLLEEIDALCKESGEPDLSLPPGYDPNEAIVEELEKKFLTLLRKDIEKVSLFVLTRQGEIAEAVGSLRFEGEQRQLEIQPSLAKTPRLRAAAKQFSGKEQLMVDEIPNSDSYGEEAELLPPGSIQRGELKTPRPVVKKSESPPRPMFRKVSDLRGSQNSVHEYTVLGVELLHLLKFICVNAMGVRKIVKKADKIFLRAEAVFTQDPNAVDDLMKSERNRLVGGPEDHLQQLANSASVAAIYASLLAELVDLEAAEMNVMPSDVYQQVEEGATYGTLVNQTKSFPTPVVRFKCVVSSIHTLRVYAQRVNRRFQEFLSSKAMIMTGNAEGDLERSSQKALSLLIRFQPDSLLLMDEADLEDWEKRIISKAGVPDNDDASLGDLHMGSGSWGGVSSAAMFINLMSTLLYTINYYIIAPTANRYAMRLGTDGAFGATLIGASSFAAIFAAFLYSVWYSKSSFRSSLLFSALCPCVGNLLYGLALSYNSMPIALWGRILVGFGSAEVVNRQIISACVSFQNMTRACALFVAAGASGMSIGPLMAAILDLTTGRDFDIDLPLFFVPSGGIIYNNLTSPGFVMAILWFLQCLALVFIFHEPERINSSDVSSDGGERTLGLVSFESEPNLSKYGSTAGIHDDDSVPVPQPMGWCQSAWSQTVSICKLIFSNMALPVTLLLFGFIELADEVLISSCSMVCRRYFSWHGSTAGFLVACLGALVLPAHFVVERASRQYSERRIMKLSLVFIVVSLFAILNYEGLIFDMLGVAAETVSAGTDTIKTTKHGNEEITIGGTNVEKILNKENEVPYNWGFGAIIYITFLSAIFMGTIILEGVDTSIMAKMTPPELNDTFINSGLLATLVGTVGRVIGDSMITLSALIDQDVFTDFVNATFFPMIPLALIGYFIVQRFYKSLL